MDTWIEVSGKLQKEFEFTDFKTAFSFMTEVAQVAEKLNHHPDWSNSYNKVNIKLFSHSEGKVSARDRQLAKRIDQIAVKFL